MFPLPEFKTRPFLCGKAYLIGSDRINFLLRRFFKALFCGLFGFFFPSSLNEQLLEAAWRSRLAGTSPCRNVRGSREWRWKSKMHEKCKLWQCWTTQFYSQLRGAAVYPLGVSTFSSSSPETHPSQQHQFIELNCSSDSLSYWRRWISSLWGGEVGTGKQQEKTDTGRQKGGGRTEKTKQMRSPTLDFRARGREELSAEPALYFSTKASLWWCGMGPCRGAEMYATLLGTGRFRHQELYKHKTTYHANPIRILAQCCRLTWHRVCIVQAPLAK